MLAGLFGDVGYRLFLQSKELQIKGNNMVHFGNLIFVLTTLIATSINVNCDTLPEQTPSQAIEEYLNAFNSGTVNDHMKEIYHFPLVWILDGNVDIQQAPPLLMVDYENLRKTGWAYSKKNSIEVLSEGENTAVVSLDFSRFTKSKQEILRTVAFYTMVKDNGKWKITTITVPISLAI